MVKGFRKRQLGQFFTTNVDFIVSGLDKYVQNKEITDPFAGGGGDLLNWGLKHGCKAARGFDVDERYVNNQTTFYRDSIKDPDNYKFVLTNPPYLHKNKASSRLKTLYKTEYSAFEDLYQISINSLLNAQEGIMIVPLNFLSAKNSTKIRQRFFSRFRIIDLNLFTRQVFEDTTYNVIAFYFKKSPPAKSYQINVNFVFENKQVAITLQQRYG